MHPLIKDELDNLQLQFGNKTMLTLDDYADLYGIGRLNAARHIRRRKIPISKEGHALYVSLLDLATYKAKCKLGNNPLIPEIQNVAEEAKRRRGFNQLADLKKLC